MSSQTVRHRLLQCNENDTLMCFGSASAVLALSFRICALAAARPSSSQVVTAELLAGGISQATCAVAV